MALVATILLVLLAAPVLIHGLNRLNRELLANFEHSLLDDYREQIAAGSIGNVDEFLGSAELQRKVKEFVNSFGQAQPYDARSRTRGKRDTAAYYGALLDSSKFNTTDTHFQHLIFICVITNA